MVLAGLAARRDIGNRVETHRSLTHAVGCHDCLEWVENGADAIAAEAEARRLWTSKSEHELFSFDYSDIESVHVEEA